MNKNAKLILDIINNSCNHPTAEDIFMSLRDGESRMSIATVYNNLNTLVNENLIKKLTFDGETCRYDRVVHHDHLVCDKCGKVVDFKFKDLTDEITKCIDADIIDYDLRINYVCDDCKKSKNY